MNNTEEINKKWPNRLNEKKRTSWADSLFVYPRIKGDFLLRMLGWTLLGTVLYFCVYGLLARGGAPFQTFLASSIGGAAGVWCCSYWMKKIPRSKWVRVSILCAYLARIVVGVIIYLVQLDHNYFDGDGAFIGQSAEYEWTYDKAVIAANLVEDNKDLLVTREVYAVDNDKDASIHTWMGWLFVAGKSRHALDLAPFNSFHHAITGLIICSLALALGYSVRSAQLAGVITAWIPWAFPASLMWRDSVGLAWVAFAVLMLVMGLKNGWITYGLVVLPAGFLAYSVREIYVIVTLTVLLGAILGDKTSVLRKSKLLTRLFYIFALGLLIASIAKLAGGGVFYRYVGYGNDIFSLPVRLLKSPLLLIRALIGPFPWLSGNFDLFCLFDYSFHVFQTSLLFSFIERRKVKRFRLDALVVTGLAMWIIGVMATGVHTAYIAIAIPFLLPAILEVRSNILKWLGISFILFLLLNTVYVLLGLQGSGIIMKATGY